MRFGLSHAHKVPPLFGTDARTHTRMHGHESYVPRSAILPAGDKKHIELPAQKELKWFYNLKLKY